MTLPELLAPAGSLERLKVAVLYGANAVYLSGHRFGLRSGADNFTDTEIIEGLRFLISMMPRSLSSSMHSPMTKISKRCQTM